MPLTGGEEEGGASWGASKRGRSQTRTHQLEGRKREERVGELRNVACHKQGLTNWRGGRGKGGFVSFEMWKDLKRTRLNAGHQIVEYAGFLFKIKKNQTRRDHLRG